MNDKRSTWTGLWRELQRRHVVRVTLGYAAVAFVVLQMGEIILPAFTSDPLWMQILVVAAALLFPVIIALAWVYEVTPKGIRRMAKIDEEMGHVTTLMPVFPRLALLVVTLVVVGVTAWWAVSTGIQGARVQGDGGSNPFGVQPELATYNADEPIRSLAVLPLDNFSEDGGQDFFAASLHEAIVAQLSRLPALRVVSRTSAMRFVGTTASVPQIGAELGVDGVVEGSVTRVGDAVRVTVRLIHAASDTEIWTEQYDGKLDDILALQREVSEAIATAIQGELLPEERQALLAYRDLSDDMEANEAMMRGRTAATRGTQSDLLVASEYFGDAIEMDPTFAPAYAEQARVQIELGMLQEDTTVFMEHLPRAMELVRHAITLDAESPQVREVWRFVRDLTDGGFMAVIPTGAVGTDLVNPGGSTEIAGVTEGADVVVLGIGALADTVNLVMAAPMSELGRRLEARFAEWVTRSAWNGRGRSEKVTVHAAESMARSGRTEDALDLLTRLRQKVPGLLDGWDAAERILAAAERYDDIVTLRWSRAEALAEDAMSLETLQAEVEDYGADGYWEWKFEELSVLAEHDRNISHVDFAIAFLRMGDPDGALDHLEEAARLHDERLARERNNPAFDELRSEPRFRRLMAGASRGGVPRRPGRRNPSSGAGTSGSGHG